MKYDQFTRKVTASRPDDEASHAEFTDAVMKKVKDTDIFSNQIRIMNVKQKETFIMRLKRLPRFALIALILSATLLATGTTYAVVKTISDTIKVNSTSTNEFGREQVNVSIEHCNERNGKDVAYELKQGSNLTADDGIKAIQAACELEQIAEYLKETSAIAEDTSPPYLLDSVDTITSVGNSSVTLKSKNEQPTPPTTKYISNNKEVSKNEFKAGDTVAYITAKNIVTGAASNADFVYLFKTSLPPNYYSFNVQSYVNLHGPCTANPTLRCLVSNGMNQTNLFVAYGDAKHSSDETEATKELQGKVVSFDKNRIVLNTGKAEYTVETPTNVIDTFNSTTVYGLKDLDEIYSKTDPEKLKVEVGDYLRVNYLEATESSARTIVWSQVFNVMVMVERIPNNLSVLRKY